MTHQEQLDPRYRDLAILVLALTAGAAVLNAVAGPPHLPSQLPSWPVVSQGLRGSSLPLGILAYLLTMAAWGVWMWVAASLLLRLAVTVVAAVAHGATWVRTLRALSDRVTLPIVRRAVDGALVTVLVVNVVSRTVPIVGAAAPPAVHTNHVTATWAPAESHAQSPRSRQDARPRSVDYTVQPGDTLWAIAERFYGTGYEFPRLVAANAGRMMPDGARFTRAGVLQPGWLLRVPLPSQAVHEVDGKSYYVVEEGDTLQGIAARLLGNEDRWVALFDLNHDRAALDGQTLSSPDLIWPGLRLTLPIRAAEHVSPPAPHRAARPQRKRPAPELRKTPVTPTPTRVSNTPTPAATAIAPTPIPVAVATPAVRPSGAGNETELILGMVGAAATMLAGGAVVAARRRVRRSLSEPPIPKPKPAPPVEEFAEAEPARVLRHRLQGDGMEPVIAVTGQLFRLLEERDIHEVFVVTAIQGRNTVALLLRAQSRERDALPEVANQLAALLGAKCRISETADHDVSLLVSGFKLASLVLPVTCQPTGLCLLPTGLMPDGQMLYANWSQLGHVFIAGLPGGGADVILIGLTATLASRRRPDTLQLWTIADQRTLPTQLAQLPHQISSFIDPHDESQVDGKLADIRAILTRRIRAAETGQEWRATREEPEIVLVVDELANLPDDGTTLELIGSRGPDHGVRLLVASSRAEALSDAILSYFNTHLILQTMDDDESIRLLGQPEGADLGSGELFLRIDGRSPVRIRGLHVSPEHLDELIRVMREEYEGLPAPAWSPATRDHTEVHTVVPVEGNLLEEDEDDTLSPGGADELEVIPEPQEPDEPEERLPVDPVVEIAHSAGDCGSYGPEIGNALIERQPLNGHTPTTTEELGELIVPPPEAESPGAGALIQVRCFGEFTVRSGDREITPYGEEGPAYKSWEILAFLATQPGGAVSRDKLLAAIWPDASTDRAANRLRVALARLRSLLSHQVPDLPPEVVRVDRESMCRLDPALVTSDVHQFLDLIHDVSKLPPEQATAALQQAHALYQGDLLTGRGARFYEWVEERDESGVTAREHYREEYHRATQRLARLYRREGEPSLAVPLYKDLLKTEPTLEDVVRELYRCYEQMGDLNSLIREERHLRQALRDAFAEPGDAESDLEDYQPEPKTVELFEKIREELEPRSPGTARRH